MKNPMHLVLALLILLSFCAVGGVVGVGMLAALFVRSNVVTPAPLNAMVPLVTAAVDLPAGTVLDDPDRQLIVQAAAPGTIPANSFSNPADVRGQTLTVAVGQGAPLLRHQLAPAAPLLKLAPGMRAVTIAVDLEGGMSFILPGSRVDILRTTAAADHPARKQARVVAEDVLVLAVEVKAATAGKVVRNAHQLTVALTAEDAAAVAQGKDDGALSVVLRPARAAD